MTQAFRDFSEYSAGDLATVGAADWTVSTLTGDWSVVVDGTPAIVSDQAVSGDGPAHALFSALAAQSGDIEVYALIENAGAYEANIGFGPALMAADESAYALAIDGSGGVRIVRFSSTGGASGVVGNTLTLTLSTATKYHVVIGRSGTTIRARIWADGDSDPGTFQMSGTNTAIGSVFGAVFQRNASATPQTTTAFGVGTAGDSAPTSGAGGASITGSVTHALTPGATMAYTAATVTVSGTQANGRELRDENQAVIASQTISYEWYDKTTDTDGDPLQSGTFNTDANGEWSITLSGSVLGNGANGTLILEFGSDRGIYELPVVRS